MRSASDRDEKVRSGCAGLRAVVVEDDPAVMRLTVRALEDLGLTCASFYDAEAAFSHLLSVDAPDILCVDIALPLMSGLSLVRELRKYQRFARSQVLFLTARSEITDALSATRLGGRFLTKPYRLSELRDTVTEMLIGKEQRKRIMIVDDDEGIREALHNIVREEGFEPVCARDGLEALRLLRLHTPPELVLLDIMMPGLDGVSVANEISAKVRATTPIVFVSAMDNIAAEARRVGAFGHLRKPVELDDVVRTIHRAVPVGAGPFPGRPSR